MSMPRAEDPQPELRQRYREYQRAWRAWEEDHSDLYPGHPLRPRPPALPPECADLLCGATTRRGTPCRRKDIGAGGRCKLHGGMSTGPRTKKGKRRAAKNAKRTPCGRDKT